MIPGTSRAARQEMTMPSSNTAVKVFGRNTALSLSPRAMRILTECLVPTPL